MDLVLFRPVDPRAVSRIYHECSAEEGSLSSGSTGGPSIEFLSTADLGVYIRIAVLRGLTSKHEGATLRGHGGVVVILKSRGVVLRERPWMWLGGGRSEPRLSPPCCRCGFAMTRLRHPPLRLGAQGSCCW